MKQLGLTNSSFRTGAYIYMELKRLEEEAKEAIDAVNLVEEELGKDTNAYRILNNASKEAHKALQDARCRQYTEQPITYREG